MAPEHILIMGQKTANAAPPPTAKKTVIHEKLLFPLSPSVNYEELSFPIYPLMNPEELSFSVNPLISPADQMYNDNKEHYFHCGRSALFCIQQILKEYRLSEPKHILDFACGYGRVLRFLKACFPNCYLSVFDKNRHAAQFCVEKLGADERIYSYRHLQKISALKPPDLIWCGSLFTHIKANQAGKILQLFQKTLKPGGILIFSTHGNFSCQQLQAEKTPYGLKKSSCQKIIADFQKKSYGFQPYRLFGSYGIALSSPKWYQKILLAKNGWLQAIFYEQGWDNHQDIHCAIKANLQKT